MQVTLYSSPTCPKCKVIEAKFKKKNIEVIKEIDEDVIIAKGLKSIPWVQLQDGSMLDFKAANDWINNYQEVAE
jgi:arsenate reductase-like glutaredoxin family protein